jgi:hypothetical protein
MDTASVAPPDAAATAPLVFRDEWPLIVAHSSSAETLNAFSDIYKTFGVVGALLTTLMYRKIGAPLDVLATDSLWGPYIHTGRHVVTLIDVVNTLACLYGTIAALRLICILSMVPDKLGSAFVVHFGGKVLLDLPYIQLAIILILLVLDVTITATLTLPAIAGWALLMMTISTAIAASISFYVIDNRFRRCLSRSIDGVKFDTAAS